MSVVKGSNFRLLTDDGQSAPYCLFAPTEVAMPPRGPLDLAIETASN
jgi:hypothetical protein